MNRWKKKQRSKRKEVKVELGLGRTRVEGAWKG